MTTQQLLSLKIVRPADAAAYLQNGTYAEEIRAKARAHCCPFCTAERAPGRKVYTYRINVGALICAKWPDGKPADMEVVS